MNSAEKLDAKVAIMPLSATREEVKSIIRYIRCYEPNTVKKMLGENIFTSEVRNVLLVGSGDSYALALVYAALFNNIMSMPVRAVQSYEFLGENTIYLDDSWLIIILSASGRASPVLDALLKAQCSQARVLGITNSADSEFAAQAHSLLVTGATKVGMPTQSTLSMALYLDAVACALHPVYEKVYSTQLSKLCFYAAYPLGIHRFPWCDELLHSLFVKRVTILGSGGNAGLATMFSNLLWCGPQLASQAVLLEEYEHSLRLNQAGADDLIIIFDCVGCLGMRAIRVEKILLEKSVTVIRINNGLLGSMMSGNSDVFSPDENCHYYAMLIIFSLIISATEIYLSCGRQRVSQE